MALKDVWIKKVGVSRGRPRIYFDGLQAIRAGFSPGERFDINVDGKRIVLSKNEDGSRVVSSKKKGEADSPVIDINSAELMQVFDGMDSIRIVVSDDRVYLLPLASESKKVDRLERLSSKLIDGRPLAIGSLAHGGGVLAHAIHAGLKDSGIDCDFKFANELRDDLLLQAIENNDSWEGGTAALSMPMQELAQDDWLMGQLPKLDILEMGLPCSGASLAGHTKKGLQKMEDHEEVGHLVYSALAIISKTNPAVVLLENVPRYADTASAQILRHQFRDMGYNTHEAVLDGSDFGSLEKRLRWCMVAVTRGVEFSFEDITPKLKVVKTIGEIIDQGIGPDDERWRAVQYLKDKEIRNAEAGDSFKMQFVSLDSTKIGTLRKGYFKSGSTDPRLMHPTNLDLSRLLTAQEHARVKGVPEELIAGLPQTTAHQLLGQGIIYEPFRAVGERIGESVLNYAGDRSNGQAIEVSDVSVRRQRITG